MEGKWPSLQALTAALLPMVLLRFVGHLPYFKIGSALILPQGLSLGGAALTALLYSLLCVGVARWLTGLRRTGGAAWHPAWTPLAGAVGLMGVMMVAGPFIAFQLPDNRPVAAAAITLLDSGSPFSSMLPAYLGLLLPVCLGFLAAQVLARRRSQHQP